MLEIHEDIGGIMVDVTFHVGISCVDLHSSGNGKTLLFDRVKAYCLKNNIAYRAYNYDSQSVDVAAELGGLTGTVVVLLDNADLYWSDAVCDALTALPEDAIVLVSIKQRRRLKTGYALYKIAYDADRLTAAEVIL